MQFFISLTKHKSVIRTVLFVSMCCIVSSVALAANPPAPILPNDNIQDPGDPLNSWGGCGPTDSNCYVTSGSGSLAIGDAVGSATPGSVLFADTSGNLGEDNPNFFWNVVDKLLGVGTNAPLARIHADGQTAASSDINKPSKTVDNSNYNDFGLNGYYTGTTNDTWIVQIVDDSVDPQLFRYSADNGSTWSANLPITVGYNLLQDGVEAQFGATTGYANGDEWQFSVVAEIFGADIDPFLASVNGYELMRAGINGIRFYDAYSFPDKDGNAGDVLTTDGAGNLSWQASGGGGGSNFLAKNGIAFGDSSDQMTSDVNKLFWGFDTNRMAIGNAGADTSLDVFSSSYNQTTSTSGWQANTQCVNCTSTLNDLNLSSTGFFGVVDEEFKIVISSVGSPDTFDWYIDNNLQQANVPITGGAQTLTNISDSNDWIQVWFNNTTGHTNGTEWLIQGVTKKGGSLSGPTCNNCTASLNDISVDVSAYSGGANAIYTVTVDSLNPDTFSWSKDGGPVQQSNVPILSGQSQSLSDGVTIQFMSDTGHALGTTWNIDVTYQNSTTTNTYQNDPFQVRDQNNTVAFKVNKSGNLLIKGVEYAFPSSQGGNNQVLTNDGNGNLSWKTPSGGGGGSSLIGFTDSSSRYNTALGYSAGYYVESLGTGSLNTYLGEQAGYANSSGDNNVAIGSSAGHDNSTGSNNIFLGRRSGAKSGNNNNSGSDLVMIGTNTGTMTASTSNAIAIGSGAIADTDQFAVSDSITSLKLRGVRWTIPSTQGGAGQVLTNDGSGNLSWTTISGGGGSSLIGSTSTSGTETWLGDGAGSSGGSSAHTAFIGTNAGTNASGANQSIFIGNYSGASASDAFDSIFLGSYAGYVASDASQSNFFGSAAGYLATNASHSNFIGDNSGYGSTNAAQSNFIGQESGAGAINANSSNFFGVATGNGAINASYSNFIGSAAGLNAVGANNSIFIGKWAGYEDTVDNSSGGTSILIGDDTSTGGYSNSIAIGKSATNTAANQLLIDDSYTQFNMRGVNYFMPSSGATSNGQVLSSDTSGNLSWTTISNWGLTGNSGTTAGTNFVGTTDAVDLVFKTNSSEMARLKSNGNIELGSGSSATGTLFGSSFAAMGGTASGGASFAFGAGAISSGAYSVALPSSISSGRSSFAASAGTASGESASSLGYGVLSRGFSETAVGMSNTDYTPVGQDPRDRLFVVGNGDYGPVSRSDALTILKNGDTGIAIDNFENNTNGSVFQIGDGGTTVIAYVDNGTGAWVSVSDERKKENIIDLSYGIETIVGLRPVAFDYKRNGEQSIGFLAQQVKPIIPEAVFGSEESGYGMSYEKIVPVTVKAIQDIFNLADSFKTKLVTWFADAQNGITDFFAERIHTKTLCVGDQTGETCITKSQLDSLLNAQNASSGGSTGGAAPSGGGASDPEPDSAPDPEITPDPTPDQTPAGDTIPEPAPETPSTGEQTD